ncbi:alpha/beta fold hydrolase [Microbispora sp. H13382]|uniref:alpha/beta fold hydrolase n=1 Tax=Microbispora sp. H13382 TaxID=2729112 RepID=UPI0016007D1A|nr:alpha/beta fold hydrolase [Microbispora sp. H13382]
MIEPAKWHTTGSGRDVVLLHPLASSHRFWSGIVPLLTGRRVHTCDLPGHGDAPVPSGRYGVADLAAWLAAGLDRLRADGFGRPDGRFVVAGVSLGGLVAQHLAADRPDLIDRLVLADTVATYPGTMRELWRERAAVARARGMAPLVDPTIATWFTAEALATGAPAVGLARQILLNTDPEGYARACEALETADVTSSLPRITAPALVICGDDDMPAFVAAAPALRDAIVGARLEWIASARHAAVVERPDRFVSVLDAFLRDRGDEERRS